MSQDNKVISYVTPAEMVALMRETGMISVQETGNADGKPVIHAALKIVNAQTGEELPGGLPFSVVLFKNPREPGYSNIAIGTIVPAAELEITLPSDYFNFCNQRFRFTRVFPLDDRSFVLQMDMFVRNATREYVKFNLGVWAAMFSHVLFELIGRGRESLEAAAEAYANARIERQFAETVSAPVEEAVVEPVAEPAVAETAAEPASEAVAEDAVAEAPAEIVSEPVAEEAPAEAPAEQAEAEVAPEAAVAPQAEVTAEAGAAPEAATEAEPQPEATVEAAPAEQVAAAPAEDEKKEDVQAA